MLTPHLAPRLKKENTYISTPPLGLCGLFWDEHYFPSFTMKLYLETYHNRFPRKVTDLTGKLTASKMFLISNKLKLL